MPMQASGSRREDWRLRNRGLMMPWSSPWSPHLSFASLLLVLLLCLLPVISWVDSTWIQFARRQCYWPHKGSLCMIYCALRRMNNILSLFSTFGRTKKGDSESSSVSPPHCTQFVSSTCSVIANALLSLLLLMSSLSHPHCMLLLPLSLSSLSLSLSLPLLSLFLTPPTATSSRTRTTGTLVHCNCSGFSSFHSPFHFVHSLDFCSILQLHFFLSFYDRSNTR